MKHIGIRHKIRIKNEEIVAFGGLGAILQGSRFVSCAVDTMNMLCVKTSFDELCYLNLTNLSGFVCGVI